MNDTAVTTILEHAEAGADLRRDFFAQNAALVAKTALFMAVTLAKGNKILFCGNGGSAADCQHLAAEFVNRYRMDRPPLPALALTTDSSALTAIGNDFSFSQVFAKQVQALGNPGDLLVVISTSGNSENILLALQSARARRVATLGLSGRGGGAMAGLCDMLIDVQGGNTALIQEIHIAVGHLLCGLTDYYLFENVAALAPYLAPDAPMPA